MAKKITEDMAGCWLEGASGWTNSYRVIDRAQEWGFQIAEDEQRLVDVYRMDDVQKVVNLLLEEELGNPGSRGRQVAVSMDAVTAKAEALHEEAIEAVTGQGGLSDQATEYLDSLAPEGMAFEWDMGELSLLCLCQIEGTEENTALLKTDEDQCESCKARWSR